MLILYLHNDDGNDSREHSGECLGDGVGGGGIRDGRGGRDYLWDDTKVW